MLKIVQLPAGSSFDVLCVDQIVSFQFNSLIGNVLEFGDCRYTIFYFPYLIKKYILQLHT